MQSLSSGEHLKAAERIADDMDVESYATASFVIEQFWEMLQCDDLEGFRATVREHLTTVAPTIPEIAAALRPAIQQKQHQFITAFIERVRPGESVSTEDALFMRYVENSQKRISSEGLPFPSMLDLPALYARWLVVSEKVYERDLGSVPAREELFTVVDTPQTKRLLMEVMTNSRSVANFILVILENEGKPYADLDDPNGTFDPGRFSLQTSEKGARYVSVRPDIVERIVTSFGHAAVTRAEAGKEPFRALQCPVLYTGTFSDMFDWTAARFKEFYK